MIQKCDDCQRERTLADVNDYNPLQVVMGAPIGWYAHMDCPPLVTVNVNNNKKEGE